MIELGKSGLTANDEKKLKEQAEKAGRELLNNLINAKSLRDDSFVARRFALEVRLIRIFPAILSRQCHIIPRGYTSRRAPRAGSRWVARRPEARQNGDPLEGADDGDARELESIRPTCARSRARSIPELRQGDGRSNPVPRQKGGHSADIPFLKPPQRTTQ